MEETNRDSLNVRGGLSYNSEERWRVVDSYNSTYWSGLDVNVYANNIRLEEAVQVSYQILEPIRPLYNYASHVANRIIHGQRIVAGELTLNFKRDGYLFSLLDALKKEDNWLPASRDSEVNSPIPAVLTEYGAFNYDDTIKADIKAGKYKGKLLSDIIKTVNDRELQTSTPNSQANISNNSGMLETTLGGFDLNIIYGSQIKSEQVLRFTGSDTLVSDATTTNDPKADTKIASGLKLVGVSLGGISKVISDDGRALMETYTFQAKNIQIIKLEDLFIG
jgi:hypothetical protein